MGDPRCTHPEGDAGCFEGWTEDCRSCHWSAVRGMELEATDRPTTECERPASGYPLPDSCASLVIADLRGAR